MCYTNVEQYNLSVKVLKVTFQNLLDYDYSSTDLQSTVQPKNPAHCPPLVRMLFKTFWSSVKTASDQQSVFFWFFHSHVTVDQTFRCE